MSAQPANRRFRILALALGAVLGLALGEVVLRLVDPPREAIDVLAELAAGFEPPPPAPDCREPAPQARLREIVVPSPHPDVIYELRPEVDTCFERARVRINSRGVRRASELSIPKPETTYRILALGDSHAFGWAIPEGDTVGAQLEAALSTVSEGPDREIEVINAGVPGYSAFQEAAWLEAHGVELEPDCVVVLFVANDMGLPHFLLRPREPGFSRVWDRIRATTASKRWFDFAPNELATFVREVEMDRIPARYRHMVGEAGYRAALRKMARLAEENEFELVNVYDYSTLAVDSAALVEFQESRGVTALEMPWPKDPSFRVSDADPHFNRAGNAFVTEFVLEGLKERAVCLPPAPEG